MTKQPTKRTRSLADLGLDEDAQALVEDALKEARVSTPKAKVDARARAEKRAEARAKRLAQVINGIARWESKLRRAESALMRLTKERRRLERAISKGQQP